MIEILWRFSDDFLAFLLVTFDIFQGMNRIDKDILND